MGKGEELFELTRLIRSSMLPSRVAVSGEGGGGLVYVFYVYIHCKLTNPTSIRARGMFRIKLTQAKSSLTKPLGWTWEYVRLQEVV